MDANISVYWTLRNPDGRYLNTNYHKHTTWAAEPRLYKSVGGIRSALGRGFSTASTAAVAGGHPGQALPFNSGHSREAVEASWEARRAFYKKVAAIKTPEYFNLLSLDGYILEQKEIKFA